jgi:hypothetical protein
MEEVQNGNDQTRAGLQADAWFYSLKVAVSVCKKQGYKVFCKSKLDMGFFQKGSLK